MKSVVIVRRFKKPKTSWMAVRICFHIVGGLNTAKHTWLELRDAEMILMLRTENYGPMMQSSPTQPSSQLHMPKGCDRHYSRIMRIISTFALSASRLTCAVRIP